jgi:hypothetical protein
LQEVGEKGDQNARVGAMLQLMADRTYPQFALEQFKYRFDLGQLHVARPKDAGISGRKVGAQQVVPVAPFRLLEQIAVAEPAAAAPGRAKTELRNPGNRTAGDYFVVKTFP